MLSCCTKTAPCLGNHRSIYLYSVYLLRQVRNVAVQISKMNYKDITNVLYTLTITYKT